MPRADRVAAVAAETPKLGVAAALTAQAAGLTGKVQVVLAHGLGQVAGPAAA